jgi:hypothetical protein
MTQTQVQGLIEQYLVLESFEVTEELLSLCGASIDTRALPLLKRRLEEEKQQVILLQERGYIRMREKSEQLVKSLTLLIPALEGGIDA